MAEKFFLATFGCRANQADSAALKVQLEREGMLESESAADCSVIVLNSCTVTHRSDRQLRQLARKLRRANPAAKLVVTGCYAQRAPQALAEMQEIDLVLGNLEKRRITEFVGSGLLTARRPLPTAHCPPPTASTVSVSLPSYFHSSKVFVSDLSRETEIEVQPSTTLEGKTRPFVKIQEGCDARCSYCVIPQVRGVGRSVPLESLISQVRKLVCEGCKEIVLTGIHLGSYGSKLKPRKGLEDLLRCLLEIPGLEQIRLSSIEPMRFSRGLIDLAAEDRRLAPHFHLPLQSGADAVLRWMHRAYDVGRFADLIGEIHKRLPHACIGTDVMAGFPGETEALFDQTCRFIEQMPFSYLHVFPFSRRSGTPAAGMANQVQESDKSRRVEVLRQLSARKLWVFEDRFAGQTLRALVLNEHEGSERIGLTGNYLKLRLPLESLRANEFIRVTIERRGECLYGIPAQN